MEKVHEGSPMIIVCPPVRMRGLDILGEYHNKMADSIRFAEESPLYFVFLKNERKVEVLTQIGRGTFKTREPDYIEMERLHEAYDAGSCYYQIGDIKIPIYPERK